MRQSAKFEKWVCKLDEDVIQGEFGYEPGEFSVYPDQWYPLYAQGLTPRQAWQRALDAHKAARAEDDLAKAANWKRIQEEDARAICNQARG